MTMHPNWSSRVSFYIIFLEKWVVFLSSRSCSDDKLYVTHIVSMVHKVEADGLNLSPYTQL